MTDFAWPEEDREARMLEVCRGYRVRPPRVYTSPTQGSCCGHEAADHEPAGATTRSPMKFVPGVASKAKWMGTNRYCHEPLCSCCDFIPQEASR